MLQEEIEFLFPFLGLDTGFAVSKSPPATSGRMLNVRPYDVLEQRLRGGQRPGMTNLYSQQIGGTSSPIKALCEVTVLE